MASPRRRLSHRDDRQFPASRSLNTAYREVYTSRQEQYSGSPSEYAGYSLSEAEIELEEPRGILRSSSSWGKTCRNVQHVGVTFKSLIENVATTIPIMKQLWKDRHSDQPTEASGKHKEEIFQACDIVQCRENTGRTISFGCSFQPGDRVNLHQNTGGLDGSFGPFKIIAAYEGNCYDLQSPEGILVGQKVSGNDLKTAKD